MQTQPTEAGFHQFLKQMDAATCRVLNGDTSLWKALCSHADDATIFGGWGGFEQGWMRLDTKYSWAAARFVEGELEIEYLVTNVSGNLAYSVALERSKVRLIDQTSPASMVLRVTQLYRYEEGGWKLLHRHADPLMNITPTAAVLQK
ncbi:MAG: nuclear transport factor 2 family protein [Caldilineaceae bacterium]